MLKKAILVILLINLIGCSSEDQAIQNEVLVNALSETNKTLAESDRTISGDIKGSLSVGVDYKSSGIEAGISTDAGNNEMYFEANISTETILHLISNLFDDSNVNPSMFPQFDIYSIEKSTSLGKDKNAFKGSITFDSDKLSSFYKTNDLYLSEHSNKVALGKSLSNYNLTSDIVQLNDEVYYMAEISLTSEELINLFPFVDVDNENLDKEFKVRFYQENPSSEITHIELVLLDYKLARQNDMLYVDADISILFSLLEEDKNNE